MQRKNSFLKLRNAMAMIMAISVIVIIGTILTLSLSLTATTSKKTTDLYLYEQASILSYSAAEYAMLEMSRAQPCSLATLNFTYNTIYTVNASMQYISTLGSNCQINAAAIGRDYARTAHPTSDGSVILDITVSVPSDINVSTEPIRYFRRSIQKL